ncbi:hypothetical protein C8J56DRAFT_939174 [Mycena floridula]|nr:hypothetical protein C8J56DRAFT_939174 [Mycena floridula]
MTELGLGGLITFEIPYGTAEKDDEWTLNGVFGDPDDPELPGMEIDELLHKINAKLTYLPLCACTSFATGQAMNAMFYKTGDIHPASNGFSVDSTSPLLTESRPPMDFSKHLRPTVGCASRFAVDVPMKQLEEEEEEDYFEEDTPSLCLDTSLTTTSSFDSVDESLVSILSPEHRKRKLPFDDAEKENWIPA